MRGNCLASLTRFNVRAVASASASRSASVMVPHTQSQCAATTSPGTGAGASDVPSLRQRTRSSRGVAEPERAVSECQRRRRDDGMVVVDGLDGAPSDPARLHHAHRCRRIAVEEPHPRIDDEDVKAVMGQRVSGGDVIEHAGDLPGERAPQAGQQLVRVDLVEQRAADPVIADHSVIERVGDPAGIGDGLQVRPRAVELLCVRKRVRPERCRRGPQYPSSLGGNA